MFEGGQCYTRHFVLYFMDPIQIIPNIYALHITDLDNRYLLYNVALVFASTLAAPKTNVSTKSGQKWLENNNFGLPVKISGGTSQLLRSQNLFHQILVTLEI